MFSFVADFQTFPILTALEKIWKKLESIAWHVMRGMIMNEKRVLVTQLPIFGESTPKSCGCQYYHVSTTQKPFGSWSPTSAWELGVFQKNKRNLETWCEWELAVQFIFFIFFGESMEFGWLKNEPRKHWWEL